MTIAKTALCAAALAGLPAFAQSDEPDCTAPGAWILEACRSNTVSTNFEYGATTADRAIASAEERAQQEQATEALRWAEFTRGFDFEMQRESPVVAEDIITVTLSDGEKVPYVEMIREDGTTTERSPTLAETAAWRDAMIMNPEVERIPASRAARYASQQEPEPSTGWRLNTETTGTETAQTNPSRDMLEDMLDIPESHRGRDGTQCSGYQTPDGSYTTQNCSQTWSWSSSD